MTIEVVTPKPIRAPPVVHPAWFQWMWDSAYSHADAKGLLGISNGAFYRRIAKAPTRVDLLAMAALYEGLDPYLVEG